MKKNIVVFVVCLVFLLSFASAIPQTFNVHGKLEDSSGDPLEGTYNMSFNIYTTYTGGSSAWSMLNQDITTDSDGIYNVILTAVDLDFASQYYLGITVVNDAEMTPRINLTASPYAFEAQNVSVAGVDFNSNVDFGQNYNFTFDTDTLFVDGSNGRVGIGTASPQNKLNVAGSINFTTGSLIFPDGTSMTTASVDGFWNRSGTDVFLANSGDDVGIGTDSPAHKIDVYDDTDNGYAGRFIQDHATGWGVLIDVDSTVNNDPALWVKNAVTTGLWVGSAGGVGIGTTTPQGMLNVYEGNSGATANVDYDAIVIERNGNTGLSILSTDSDKSGISFGSLTDSIGAFQQWDYDDGLYVMGTSKAGAEIVMRSGSNSEAVRIDSSGNVGIGTTGPTKKFEVNGTAGAFNVDPDSSGGPLLNTTAGNVTITSSGGSVIIKLG